MLVANLYIAYEINRPIKRSADKAHLDSEPRSVKLLVHHVFLSHSGISLLGKLDEPIDKGWIRGLWSRDFTFLEWPKSVDRFRIDRNVHGTKAHLEKASASSLAVVVGGRFPTKSVVWDTILLFLLVDCIVFKRDGKKSNQQSR